MYNSKIIQRFWANVEKRGPGDCWIWLGSYHHLDRPGKYGRMKPYSYGPYRSAHILSFEINKGEVPKGLYVCHSCDNPPCVNPAHLWLGTAADNIEDAKKKGRLKIPNWNGRSHKEETKRKIDAANSISQAGARNSQYGTSWIRHSLTHKSRKVRTDEVLPWIEKGWERGRFIGS